MWAGAQSLPEGTCVQYFVEASLTDTAKGLYSNSGLVTMDGAGFP